MVIITNDLRYKDFDVVRRHLASLAKASEGEGLPVPPELPPDPSYAMSSPGPEATSRLLQGMDAFVRYLVRHYRGDISVGNLLGTNRKFRAGGTTIPGEGSWEEHFSDKFQQVEHPDPSHADSRSL